MRTSSSVIGVATLVLVALGGCGDTGGAGSDVSLVEGVTEDVRVLDNTYRPEDIEVAAGTEVVWENRGRNDHNVLPVEGDDWGVDADDFERGDVYSHRFTEPGRHPYYCSLHGTKKAGMVGTIVVTG